MLADPHAVKINIGMASCQLNARQPTVPRTTATSRLVIYQNVDSPMPGRPSPTASESRGSPGDDMHHLRPHRACVLRTYRIRTQKEPLEKMPALLPTSGRPNARRCSCNWPGHASWDARCDVHGLGSNCPCMGKMNSNVRLLEPMDY